MTFKDHFSSGSKAYAAFRPTYPPALVDRLAEACRSTDVAWDVGCGSGQLSTLLAARFKAVLGTDASQNQIDHATKAERVTYLCRPAEDSGFFARSVDCIVVAQAAHWFDMPRFNAECVRVGRPGALVALVSYGLMFVEPRIDECVSQFALETLKDHWPPERHHVDTGYRELAFPFTPVTLPPISMRAEWSCDQTLGYVGTWSAVGALSRAGQSARLTEFAAELIELWGPGARAVEWPLVMRAGRIEG
jgi:SAM-dependent methyltransferase